MKLGVVVVGVLVLGMIGSVGKASAGDQVCGGMGSGKIDTVGDPETVTVTAPDGWLIDGYCVKSGSVQQGNGPVYVVVDPPRKTVVIAYPGKDSVSHYSYSLVRESTTTTAGPTTTIEPTTTTEVTTSSTTTTQPTEESSTTTFPPTTIPESTTSSTSSVPTSTTTPAPTTTAHTDPTTPSTLPSELPHTGGVDGVAILAGVIMMLGVGLAMLSRGKEDVTL
jgi:LPXTG-motif cell wall-anchored protein